MSKISTYPLAALPKLQDKLIGTSVDGNPINATYNFTLGQLKDLFQFSTDGLQAVLDVQNYATQDIIITGDGSFSNTLSFGTLKDIGEEISITKFVDSADGIVNNNNDTSIPTSAAIIAYVLTQTGSAVSSVTGTSPIISSEGLTPNISITQSGTASDGYLSSTDWNTFNGKQSAGDYITSLTGEATATGPGASSVTLNNSAVTGKLLTSLVIPTAGTVTSEDSILIAFGKMQTQINENPSGLTYQGTWNANTNTPTLASGVGISGYYYIVDVAGATDLDGITDWVVGDWAIFASTSVWQKIDNTGIEGVGTANKIVKFSGPSTVTDSIITETNTVGEFSKITIAGELIVAQKFTLNTADPTRVGIPSKNLGTQDDGTVVEYDLTNGTVTSVSELTLGTEGNDLSSTVADSTTTPVITLNVPTASATKRGVLRTDDWSTFNNKQGAITLTTNGTGSAATFGENVLNIPIYSQGLTGSGIANHPAFWTSETNLSVAADILMGVRTVQISGENQTSNFFSLGQGYNVTGAEGRNDKDNAIISTQYASLLGERNVSLGYNTFMNNTSLARANTAIGWHALEKNEDGQNNVALGSETLRYSIDSSNNIAIGYQSLSLATASSNNIAIGYQSLSLVTYVGSKNIAIGHNAALDITTASNNVFIGGFKGISIYKTYPDYFRPDFVTGNNNIVLSSAHDDGATDNIKFSIDTNKHSSFWGKSIGLGSYKDVYSVWASDEIFFANELSKTITIPINIVSQWYQSFTIRITSNTVANFNPTGGSEYIIGGFGGVGLTISYQSTLYYYGTPFGITATASGNNIVVTFTVTSNLVATRASFSIQTTSYSGVGNITVS